MDWKLFHEKLRSLQYSAGRKYKILVCVCSIILTTGDKIKIIKIIIIGEREYIPIRIDEMETPYDVIN